MNDVMEKLGFALDLQETADAEKEKINPGGEYCYPDIVFPVARDIDVDSETELDSNVIAVGDSLPGSSSFMSSDMLSSTTI
ncbi:hypothetical protein REPUB_Repub09cG0058600 [Reevesia pubescens]